MKEKNYQRMFNFSINLPLNKCGSYNPVILFNTINQLKPETHEIPGFNQSLSVLTQQQVCEFSHNSFLSPGFISKQIYTYSDYKELNDILIQTQMKDQDYFIHQDEKIIEYKFDRKQYIRLSDLVYWIQQNFIRIHIGQLLDIFVNILEYIKNLETRNIFHEYLDSNRIWLVIKEGCNFPNIVYEKLEYSIVFTGYQCSLYESQETPTKGSSKIIDIITGIIQLFMAETCKNTKFTANIKLIFKDLYLHQIIGLKVYLENLKIQYNYDCDKQMIQLDEWGDQQRQSYLKQINLKIKEMFTYFKESSQLIVEKAFQLLVPQLVESIQSNQKYPKIDDKFKDFVKQQLCDQQQKFYQNRTKIINQGVKEEIKKYKSNYKFKFSESEKGDMEFDLQYEIQKNTSFKYFENSIWYYIPQMPEDSCKLLAENIIQERVGIAIQLKILKLILELE